MKLFVTQLLLTVLCMPALAQQDPVYAQYPNNPFVLNPAYTGLNNRFNANLQYRSQWSAVEGHPETFNFNTHMSILDNKAGVGLIVVQDKIGENTTTEVSATGSYKIKLQGDRIFSFGMQMGMMRFTNSNADLNLQQGDPYFTTYNISRFNTGAGAMLKSDRYMVGFSVPRLLPVTVDQGGGQRILVYDRTYYLFGSYQVFLNERVRLRPAMLLHTSDKFKGSVDLNMNLQIEDFYSAGVFTRSFNTYGLLLQMIVKHYRFGYAIEVPGAKTAIPFTTHEFMLGISLRALRSHQDSFSVF
ncbi:MAG TPA: PorP/SprF family type IX secretion system membrane protein [Cyclobacteriaceae bacterium]|jgi:type IX secretion system PorP/SprF family membrane protein|nr:PorP/SprF family type IX secretion system membrane protein [Cyclobacteriaceae bacterium]